MNVQLGTTREDWSIENLWQSEEFMGKCTILLMQIFARSIPLWGLKTITWSNFGSLIQHKHYI